MNKAGLRCAASAVQAGVRGRRAHDGDAPTSRRRKKVSVIPPEQALDLVLGRARPLPAEHRPLIGALGYCLAENVRADRDMPPADRSAMDGYAVRWADLPGCPRALRLTGEVASGSSVRPEVEAGTCVRVFTGANIPPGADTVVMAEHTTENGDTAVFRQREERGANILHRGEDARKGALLLIRGTVLGPLQIGVCASVGKVRVKVRRRPRVAVVCTGKELQEVSARVRAYQQRNSNGPALCAALTSWGYGGATYCTVPDRVATLVSKLRRLTSRADVVLMTGGVSVGKYDFVPEAVARIGAVVRFHGVRMKPGKPLLYATLDGNRHIFGLPGTPLAAMVGFHEFALPALNRLAGVPADACRPALHLPLASRLVSKAGRVRFVLARVQWHHSVPLVAPIESHSPADLAAGGRADGVIMLAADAGELRRGSVVKFHPWRGLP